MAVADSRTTGLAARSLLAGLATGHSIVEFQVAVELDIDVHVSDREVGNFAAGSTARERWALARVALSATCDAFSAACTLPQEGITLHERARAGESREVDVSVG